MFLTMCLTAARRQRARELGGIPIALATAFELTSARVPTRDSLRAFLHEQPAWFDIRRLDGDEAGELTEFLVQLLENDDTVEGEGEEQELIEAKIGTAALEVEDEPFEDDELPPAGVGGPKGGEVPMGDAGELSEQQALWLTLQSRTVPELRAELRARGLPSMGNKGDLLQRLYSAVGDDGTGGNAMLEAPQEAAAASNWVHPSGIGGASGASAGRPDGRARGGARPSGATGASGAPLGAARGEAGDRELVATVTAYLEGAGGSQSSRNVGRHLAARGQLQQLKDRYSGLFHFLQGHPAIFRLELPADRGVLEYGVHLRSQPVVASSGEGTDAKGSTDGAASESD